MDKNITEENNRTVEVDNDVLNFYEYVQNFYEYPYIYVQKLKKLKKKGKLN